MTHPENPEMVLYDAVCVNPGCENEGAIVRILATADDPRIYCGACADEDGHNTRITDVTLVEGEP